LSYPTQSGTLNRLEAETRKAGRAHEDACVDALKREWEAAKKSLRGIIMAEYHAAHGSETWNLANAGMTIERINHFSTNELVGFFNSILRFMRDTVKDAYRHEALRHVWMLDMLTPPSRKPRIPGKALREALRPEDYKTGWEQALAEWLRAYAVNLNTNLRLEALHEGSITDAADEVDATKVDNFDPIYKLSSMLFMHILQAQRDARDDVAGENEDLVAEEIFQTLEDSAVCFPAGTLVSTPDGDKAIESLKLGEVILTHLGRKRITGTVCRLYSGSMVTIKTKGAKLITTASHPIYEKGRGWVRADSLDVGDIIGQVGANYRGCISGVQDTFQNSYHDKTVGNEVSIFAGVTGLVAMPIISISFQGNAMFRDKEVNRISPNFGLLQKFYAKCIQGFSDLCFKARFGLAFAIARLGTETNLRRRADTHLDATHQASNMAGWSSAFLRAMNTLESWASIRIKKNFTASFTNNAPHSGLPAFATTSGIPISLASKYGKFFAAHGTDFSYAGRGKCPACGGTKTLTAFDSSPVQIKGFLASRTNKIGPLAWLSPLRRFGKLVEGLIVMGYAAVASVFNVFYHTKEYYKHPSLSIVFNLDVEDAHSYFANGILVHNCPDCDAEDGKPADEAEPIPVHYGCRCFTRIVPRDFAELLRNGTDDEKQAALDMDARGLVPDAMAIRDAEGNLQAHLHVDFDTWAGLHGISIVGWAK